MNLKNSSEITRKLEKISPSVCLAKWYHLSLHLDRGTGHSCYHNPETIIPAEDLENWPALIHNTPQNKMDRNEMMLGQRPNGCLFCWRQEDAGTKLSDRILKSSSPWAAPFIHQVEEHPFENVNPKYLEVSFSNVCQMRCLYCGPHNSSSWASEISRFGNFTNRQFPDANKKESIDEIKKAFLRWWPDLIGSLKILRVTGGEPFLACETWSLLDKLVELPNKELSLIINSNLSLESNLIKRFCDKANLLLNSNAVQSIKIVTSMEACENAAEYIRYGINIELFWQNIKKILNSIPDITVSVTCTIQSLSVESFPKFLEQVLDFRTLFPKSKLTFDPSPLVSPKFLRVELLPSELKKKFQNSLKDIISRRSKEMLPNEINKIENIVTILNSQTCSEEVQFAETNLFKYLSAVDRIRKTKFDETFPELKYLIESYEKN